MRTVLIITIFLGLVGAVLAFLAGIHSLQVSRRKASWPERSRQRTAGWRYFGLAIVLVLLSIGCVYFMITGMVVRLGIFASPTPSPAWTATKVPSETQTKPPVWTSIPIPTDTPALTFMPAQTSTSTLVPSRTPLPTDTHWATWTASRTPTVTSTRTPTPIPPASSTFVPTWTPRPTDTRWPDLTPTSTK